MRCKHCGDVILVRSPQEGLIHESGRYTCRNGKTVATK